MGCEKTIDHITRTHFAEAASEAGLSKKLALKRFDTLVDGFENALDEISIQLSESGYPNAKAIKEQILQHGGYSHL